MSNFESMGKEQLRQACREAGISYGKLNNEGMRAALTAKALQTNFSDGSELPPEQVTETPVDDVVTEEPTPVRSEMSSLVSNMLNGAPKTEAERQAPATAKRTSSGLKIEKDREERNGIKRPSVGGLCRAVWDALDEMMATGTAPSSKEVKVLAESRGWNPNNASIEFYQWRKFHGIRGRQ